MSRQVVSHLYYIWCGISFPELSLQPAQWALLTPLLSSFTGCKTLPRLLLLFWTSIPTMGIVQLLGRALVSTRSPECSSLTNRLHLTAKGSDFSRLAKTFLRREGGGEKCYKSISACSGMVRLFVCSGWCFFLTDDFKEAQDCFLSTSFS